MIDYEALKVSNDSSCIKFSTDVTPLSLYPTANGNTTVQSNSKPTPNPEQQKLSSNTNNLNDKTIPALASAATAPAAAAKAKNQRDSRNRRNGGGGGGGANKPMKTIPDQSQTHVNSNTDKHTVNGTA